MRYISGISGGLKTAHSVYLGNHTKTFQKRDVSRAPENKRTFPSC